MSGRDAHTQAAVVNAAIARDLRQRGSSGLFWIPTVLFYTAVQLLEAALAVFAEHPPSHSDRRSALASRWPKGLSPFENLKQLSEDWRYKAREPTPDDIGRAFRWCDDVAVAIGEPSPVPRV